MTAVDLPRDPPAPAPAASMASGPAGPAPPPPLIDTPETRDALNCPLCGYSLRGLAAAEHPQCPECGYAFGWLELLRARQYSHPYLFEHHPRCNVRSLLRTLAAGLRPRRFWSSLNAGHEIRPNRLLAYWVVVTLGIVLTMTAGVFVARGTMLYYQNVIWPTGATPNRPWAPAFLRAVYDAAFDSDLLEIHLLLAAVAWPWLTMATLLVFRASMRRVRVRPAHVMRCVVYCGDVFVWIGGTLVTLAILRWYGWLGDSRMWDDTLTVRRAAGCFLVLLAVATYRLGVAYRRYLRFDHPWSTAVASQVVVLLVLTTVLSWSYEDFWKLMPRD